jgi:hypothetical protein
VRRRSIDALRPALQHQSDAVLLNAGLGVEDGLASIGDLRRVELRA